jgi:hypothetical protein
MSNEAIAIALNSRLKLSGNQYRIDRVVPIHDEIKASIILCYGHWNQDPGWKLASTLSGIASAYTTTPPE